jgi:hypothetical protein
MHVVSEIAPNDIISKYHNYLLSLLLIILLKHRNHDTLHTSYFNTQTLQHKHYNSVSISGEFTVIELPAPLLEPLELSLPSSSLPLDTL